MTTRGTTNNAARWLEKARGHKPVRPSNAKHRCARCCVEVSANRKHCSHCSAYMSPARRRDRGEL